MTEYNTFFFGGFPVDVEYIFNWDAKTFFQRVCVIEVDKQAVVPEVITRVLFFHANGRDPVAKGFPQDHLRIFNGTI